MLASPSLWLRHSRPAQSRKAIDADSVVRLLVLDQPSRALAGRPRGKLRAVSFEPVERHAVPAGIRDPVYRNAYDRATSRLRRKRCSEVIEFVIVRFQHFAATMKPNDAWSTLKRTQHDDDAPVLSEVTDGLSTAADVIQIRS